MLGVKLIPVNKKGLLVSHWNMYTVQQTKTLRTTSEDLSNEAKIKTRLGDVSWSQANHITVQTPPYN